MKAVCPAVFPQFVVVLVDQSAALISLLTGQGGEGGEQPERLLDYDCLVI